MTHTIMDFLPKFGPEYVERNVLYTNSANYKNYPKYLVAALGNDWGADFNPENQALLSKQGLRSQTEQQNRDRQFHKMLHEREAENQKDQERQRFVDSLTSEQFAELTKLVIENFHPFDTRRYRLAKNNDRFWLSKTIRPQYECILGILVGHIVIGNRGDTYQQLS